MPLEIASAAFRLHPLVKGRYTLSNDEDSALIQSLLRPEPKQPLLPHQAVDWNLFFGPDDARKFAARLEPKLAAPLVSFQRKTVMVASTSLIRPCYAETDWDCRAARLSLTVWKSAASSRPGIWLGRYAIICQAAHRLLAISWTIRRCGSI